MATLADGLVRGPWTSVPAKSISLDFACFLPMGASHERTCAAPSGTAAVAVGLEGGHEGAGHWHLSEVCFLNVGSVSEEIIQCFTQRTPEGDGLPR